MPSSRFILISLAVAASMAGSILAQGDDCSGALSIANGTSGPYTNAGSTTSAPAWPCGAGGNDVWFSYLALGTGPLTVDTCGASYDSTIEVFDGTGGCGALTSLVCNDDSCGLQSSVNVASVTVGTTYFIRVGGFGGGTGSFPLNVAGPAASPGVATVTPYGTGCVQKFTSFYENFVAASSFDLSNSGLALIRTSPGYVALGLGTYVAPTGAATTLALGDDDEVTQALTTPFPYDGGSATSLAICSNGFVSVAAGNGSAFTPSVPTLLNDPQTSWRCWHDYNPTIAGGGVVKFEEAAGIAYVTWDGVWDYGGTSAANANTFQMQFDTSNGSVTFVWQTMSSLGGSTATGFVVGYSPGGASVDPGNRDISATLPNSFVVSGADSLGLAHAASARPIIGNAINLNTSNIGPSAFFGAVLLSLTQHNPGIDLTGLGMAGCFQYQGNNVTMPLFFPLGSPTASTPFLVPNLLGFHIYTQSAVYDPTQGTALGAVSSNGLDLLIGTL